MTDLFIHTAVYNSPLGVLRLESSESGITGIHFTDTPVPDGAPAGCVECDTVPAVLRECAQQLDEYFAGTRRAFSLALDLRGTPFQQRVWALLCTIPFGTTTSYGALARQLGDIKTIRAVGGANGRNPVAIVVPCHRVIGADGTLTGYAGGLWRKQWLLHFEGATPQPGLFS